MDIIAQYIDRFYTCSNRINGLYYLAAKALGWKVMTPVFDGATEKEISDAIKEQYGFDIAKTKLVSEPIKAFGTYDVKCKLGYEITGVVKVTVKEG